jgi:hypothetical protein
VEVHVSFENPASFPAQKRVSRTQGRSEQECALALRSNLVQSFCRHDEHVLGGIVGTFVRKAKSSEQAPDEVMALVEQALESRAITLRAGRPCRRHG